ncbi:C69 family dipeptidase [Limosilactobacillus sp.]|uniref:C69 family dipeptidase n=1 Tax=Limosilactobacillus sp. TaxID=2773925 RepID=UPI00345E41E3
MNDHFSSCTSILVGKNASTDHSILIGRNEDAKAAWPKRMVVHAHGSLSREFVSKDTGLKLELPANSARYTATPEWTDKEGLFEEDGINEYDVAMSATESAYSNDLVLGFDPLVKSGLNEEAMITVVLPFIKTAREGVKRLGQLIEQYGTGETNGVLFADNNEAWYFESGGGHYWVAQRIPDDSYAVVANQLAIQEIDFDDPDNFMFQPNIRDFVAAHNLNPDPDGFNFRHIFGTANRSDAIYSTPRVWYGHQMFNPHQCADEMPESQDLPFIVKPEHQLSLLDVQSYLGSHFQGTPFDPLAVGKDPRKGKYRPVSLAKTQESHILQMNRPSGINIHWLAMGVTAESTYVPFFNGITDVLSPYKRGKLPSQDSSAYWTFKNAGVLVDAQMHDFLPQLEEVQHQLNQAFIRAIAKVDQEAPTIQNMAKRQHYLTEQSKSLASLALKKYRQLTAQLLTQLTDYSPLNFDTDEKL